MGPNSRFFDFFFDNEMSNLGLSEGISLLTKSRNLKTRKGHFSTLTSSIALILFLIEFKRYSISGMYLQIEIL